MIQIQRGQVNDVVVTLTELTEGTDPIYLFLFTSQQANTDHYWIGTDLSQFKDRYNRFSLTEKADANTLAGEVTLTHGGLYNYTAYETTLNNLVGLDTAADAVPYILKTVEVGEVWVLLTATDDDTYTPDSDTSLIYQPD